MSENEIYDFCKELQCCKLELTNFVAENVSEEVTEKEIDDLVADLESDFMSLREFVINSLED